MKKGKKLVIALAIIIGVAIVVFISANLWLNATWFDNLGHIQVFNRILGTQIALGCVFFVLCFLFSGINIRAVFKRTDIKGLKIKVPGEAVEINGKTAALLAALIVVVLSVFMANNAVKQWETVQKFFNATSFELTDPIFNRDISYYVFTLPLYIFLKNWALTTLLVTLAVSGLLYYFSGHIKWENKKLVTDEKARKHVLFLLFLTALVIALSYWLARYELLFSSKGLIFGADFTTAGVVRPFYMVMIFVSLISAVIILIGMIKASLKPLFVGAGILVVAMVLFTGVIPVIVRQIVVKPNELQKETPYITDNIWFTREGYGLNNIIQQEFPVEDSLTAADFAYGMGITENLRLWDERPLKTTFAQLQGFRLYYDLTSVSVDRYRFGGEYRQVMLSAREINTNNLPQAAKTWVNEKFQYTHGYGIVMAPVNQIGPEGLPELIIKDIPPKVSVPVTIDRPEIYYGEKTYSYVFGNTKIPEFDYPKGNENVTTKYAGTGGIEIKNGWRRFLLALHFKSPNILFTNYLEPQSRMLIYRNIDQRVRMLARFLRFDSSPYIVLSEGKLYWMMDAYTTTNKYPYSNPSGHGYNYIRNSVKVTIDAYNGDVNFYVIDSKDPLIRTYGKIFPGLFKDFSEMPEDLVRHVRYPQDLFQVQAEMYSIYHMTDPTVFYNKEDAWSVPTEIYNQDPTVMKPYYAIINLDGQNFREEFVLMLPFTPSNKNNMVSWVAAMCDPENYGKIIEYKFPKEKLVFGPMQIESRIDQNTEISQLITLWGQSGSKVIRGNLLVYPIKDSLIYVEPLYLQSDQSEIPELKQVIVAYQNRIGIGADLDEALYKLFGGESLGRAPAVSAKPAAAVDSQEALNLKQLINKAVENYNEAQRRLRTGDFAGYGEYNNRLKETLDGLQKEWEKLE